MKVMFSSWMKELDRKAINDIGIPSIVLMENASKGAADFFAEEFPIKSFKNVVVIVGKGNNGGDGLAVGRILSQKGYQVEFILLSASEKFNPDPKINFQIVKNLNLKYSEVAEPDELNAKLQAFCGHNTFIIDAIFGTGGDKPITDPFYSGIIQIMNNSGLKIASIDIPSGLSESFLPQEGAHINADATATFQCLKVSHIYPDGNKYCGKIRIINIEIPFKLLENKDYYLHLIQADDFKTLLKEREIDSHKGHYGHSLNVSGSIEKPGAGILSSYAVLKSGAGLCTLAVSPENRTIAVQSHPEVMTLIYQKINDIIERLEEFNCVLMGPGLGNNNKTYDITTKLIQYARVPVVLDADSVNVFQVGKEFFKNERETPIVLTPHPGEFSKLTGLSVQEIQKNRIIRSREFAIEYNVHVVLKGHHTLIASPDGQVFINQSGNAGMATAGSGDVLAGMITGMISQFGKTHNLKLILQAAVFFHGFASDLAVEKVGEMALTASDILDYISEAFLKCDDFNTPFPFS
jgi:NAD(P)H-hydrate epimerase